MPRGSRQRVAPGISQDDLGFEVRARAAGRTRAKRFPRTATRKAMQRWQDDQRAALRQDVRTQATTLVPGTLGGDIATYAATLTPARRTSTGADFAAWLTADLKDTPRAQVTLDALRGLVHTWVAAGVAASTINHRRRALVAVYESRDGDDPPVLPRRLKREREPEPEPRAADMALLDAILDGMPDHPYPNARHRPNRAKARLRFLLWTATTPTQMQRMGPHSVDLGAKELTKPARAKGRGAPAVTLPLVEPQGLQAARAWLRAFAWGRFDTRALSRRFRAAVVAYTRRAAQEGRLVTIPPGLRLYDLRHSFLTWLAERTMSDATPGGNPLVVQHYAQHADLATTRRYMLGAITWQVRAAITVPRSVPRK